MKAIIGSQMYPWLQHFHETRGKYDDACNEEARKGAADAGLAGWDQSVTSADTAEKLPGWLKRYNLKLDSIYAGGELHTPAWRKSADSIIQQGAWAKTLNSEPRVAAVPS